MKKIVDNYGNPIWKGAKVAVGRSEGVLKGTVESVDLIDGMVQIGTNRADGSECAFLYLCTGDDRRIEDILVLNPEEKPQSIPIPKVLENFLLEEGGYLLLQKYTVSLKECKGSIDNITEFFKIYSAKGWINSAFPWSDSEYWNKINVKWEEMFSCVVE